MRKQDNPSPLLAKPVWGQTELLIAAALAVFVLVAYGPAMKGEFLWDDNDYISQSPVMDRPDALDAIWLQPKSTPQYYPLVFTTFWIEHNIWGNWTLPYHLLNVLLHIANALLLWRLLVRLRIPGAAVAAAIFALHPVNVESVAWITERKNVLSMLLFLLASGAYLRFALDEQLSKGRRNGLYILALTMFAAALLSKTSVVFLPVGLAMIIWWKTGRLGPDELLPLVPFAAMALGAGLMTTWVEGTGSRQTPAEPLEMFGRIVVAAQAVWFYLGKLFWPHPLVPIYARWDMSSISIWQMLAPASVPAVLAGLWLMRRRLGRAPLAAAVFFVAALSPMLGLVWLAYMEHSFVADHFQYIACLGVIVPLVGAAAWLIQRKPSARRLQIAWAAAVVVLAALSATTWHQAGYYRTLEAFFRFTAEHNSASPLARSNLGVTMMNAGRNEEALAEFAAALELQPGRPRIRLYMGKIYERTGQLLKAIEYYRKELDLFSNDPDPLLLLGVNLVKAQRYEESVPYLTRFLKVGPNVPQAHRALGNAYLGLKQYAVAIDHLAWSVHIDPRFIPGYHDLAQALIAAGRPGDAAAICTEALRISPGDYGAEFYMAVAYVQCGQFEQAIEAYSRAIKINPLVPQALNNLAYLLASAPQANLRRPSEAIDLSQKALTMMRNPDASALDTLAVAYAADGQFDLASKKAQEALDLARKAQNEPLADLISSHLRKFEANEMVIESIPAAVPEATSRPSLP